MSAPAALLQGVVERPYQAVHDAGGAAQFEEKQAMAGRPLGAVASPAGEIGLKFAKGRLEPAFPARAGQQAKQCPRRPSGR